jgi:hypothetical protein
MPVSGKIRNISQPGLAVWKLLNTSSTDESPQQKKKLLISEPCMGNICSYIRSFLHAEGKTNMSDNEE